MNYDNVLALERYGETYLQNLKKIPDENTIRECIIMFKPVVPEVTEEEVEQAIFNLETRNYITMDSGITLRNNDTYRKWYHNSKASRGTVYWDRYQRFLLEDSRLPIQVIDKIDEAAEEIMDSLADPKHDSDFDRKGLVIGAVQSGKTSNYIALMNKAADSGYKTIILLTGTIEKLRRQTQVRVDEGFSGTDSKNQTTNKQNIPLGVGKYKELPVTSYTGTDKDFNIAEAIKIDDQKGPVVFVLKKNKSVLEKLQGWLKAHNVNHLTGKIESPLLLIDDEADNASVNTSKEKNSPTIINKLIRDILKMFSKSSYVGFTATPFANIFIDPQFEDKNGNDLFPRDFITLLEQPSNYVGPSDMYPEEGRYNFMIRNNDDVESVLPLMHKNGDILSTIPESLKDAIMIFFLANAVRDLRGQTESHRSMLIHISRFISVQNDVKSKIDIYVNELKKEIKNYILSTEKNKTIDKFQRLYESEFLNSKMSIKERQDRDESWEEIKKYLFEAVMPIQVKVVNSGNATKDMNYDDYEGGLRIIAIGGLSLARGLTLEGLMTSYFYRNTKMYDTLMQMGRWFGYRNGYVDLCRLWTSSESAEWYAHIAEATEELRWEIKKMQAQNKKPIEFGLKVRSAEDTPLIITARNKMRSTETMKLHRSLNGQMIETPILSSKKEDNKGNFDILERWLVEMYPDYYITDTNSIELDKYTFKNIPKKHIVDLLSLLKFPLINDIESTITNIKNKNSKIIEKWDVVVASNNKNIGREVTFGPFEINPLQRQFDLFGVVKDVRLSGSKRRLGVTDYAKGGLTKSEFDKINKSVLEQRKDSTKKKGIKTASENMYFNTGISRNPLLVIYPIILKPTDKDILLKNEINKFVEENSQVFTGISIGIPDIKNMENIIYEYEINVVLQRERYGLPIGYEEDFDFEDEDDEELME